MDIKFKAWAKAALIRAIRTFFQVFASMVTVDVAIGLGDVPWLKIASVSSVSAIYSIVTSLAGLPEVD